MSDWRRLMARCEETGEVIRVYQNGQPFAVLGPRDSECGEPFASYDAEAISAVSDGYTATAGVARSKPEGRKGGVLWIASAATGEKLAEYKFDAAPVWDGMAVADGRLYMSLADGRVVCWASE